MILLQPILRRQSFARGKTFTGWFVAGIILFFLLAPFHVYSQEEEAFEISVFLNVSKIGGLEVPAVISGDQVSMSVTDVFNFLKIKNTPSQDFDSITGFFITEDMSYVIDRLNDRVQFGDQEFSIDPGGLIQTETALFLRSDYFGKIFGLECDFNFRSLSVDLETKQELPLIREMRQEMMRQNIKHLKGEVEADTNIGRSYPLFSLGMFDWAVYSTQQTQGPSNTRLNFSMGSILAGGETNIALNYTTGQPFLERQQYYLWRLANNDFKVVKQIMLGKINPYATSSIYYPVVGAQITNTPTKYRRSYGSFTLSDYTKPGWTVELYVNNVLVDYQQADPSGFYSFDVPLVYGNSEVKLKFYGPWGEEQTSEKNYNVPFSFLPKGKLEYTASGGIVEDTANSRFSRGEVGYGLGRKLTIGAGVEYLSSVKSGPTMPFAKASINLFDNLLISANYTYGVQFKGLMNFQIEKGPQFEFTYINYADGQEAINNNYREQRKAVVTWPFRKSKFSLFTRLSFDQYILPFSEYINSEFLLSGSFWGVNANLTTFAIFSGNPQPYVYSSLSMAFRLPANIIVTPQTNFEYNNNQFVSARCEVEKRLFQSSYAVVSYENNFRSNIWNFQVGLRIDFSFAQTSLFARPGNQNTAFIESARGSVILDTKTGYVAASNRTSMGKGGLIISPFLDINCNGERDENEPRVFGLNIKVTGGIVNDNIKDSTMVITELEPYTNYILELDPNNFDNIAWHLDKLSYSIAINPNQLRLIEIPVSVVGEAAGMIYLEGDRGMKGQGRITVNFYDSNLKLVASTLSEPDGYFSYLGLPPGKYTAQLDPSQMGNLKMAVTPGSLSFTINEDEEGDYVDDLEFTISKK
jgi:hypothetical protein